MSGRTELELAIGLMEKSTNAYASTSSGLDGSSNAKESGGILFAFLMQTPLAKKLFERFKVNTIFKGPYGHVLKDLDEEILCDTGPQAKAPGIIRNLRKGVDSVKKLLEILGTRHSSWSKDKAIISAPLLDVQLPKGTWQRDVYKSILIGFCQTPISPELLFHDSPTMPQVSWCPTSLLNLPINKLEVSQAAEDYLWMDEDLNLIGIWTCVRAADFSDEENYDWRVVHPFIRERLQLHLRKNQCSSFVLFERTRSAD
ncbi:MAG: hypothetical protein Q9225_005550 [Loekoesia sp. 1 TL-2023]